MLTPGNNGLNCRTLNLKGLGSLIPIGSSNKPFIGELKSDGITISGFDVLGFEDRDNDLVKDEDEIGFNDVGIFGYIGKDSHVSGLYFDDFVIHLAYANPDEGTNNPLHNTFFHDTNNDGVLDQVYVGYIAGHIHSTSGINNVYINNCKIDGGTGALSGFSYFGLAEKDDGNPKPTPMEEIIATKLAGEGSSFGGSIDFYSVYDRLATIYSAAPNESQTKYVSAETIVNNDVTGNSFIYDQTKSTVGSWARFNNANVYYRYYETDSGGVFNISTQSNEHGDFSDDNIYQCLYGESLHYTKTVTTYTFIDDWYDCFFIQNGSHYLNDRYYSDIRSVELEGQAAGWRFDGSNHLYTMVFDQAYYLNRNNYTLTTSTTANTTWTKTADNEIYTVINGVNYYLDYQDTWCLSPYKDRYVFTDGNGNYMRARETGVTNVTNEDNATGFFVKINNTQTSFGFIVGNQIYFLSCADSALTTSTTEYYWNIDASGHYYTSVDNVNLYIVYENGQWFLTPSDGFTIFNEGYNLNLTNSIFSHEGSTIWFLTSTTGDTQICSLLNNQRYYLGFDNGLTVSTTPTTWHRNGDGLYVSDGSKDYYLVYQNGWKVQELEYYLIHDETSTNYLKIDAVNSYSNTTNPLEATHFYFSNVSGTYPTGTINFVLNNTIYYINAVQSSNVGSMSIVDETSTTKTNWSNDGNTIYIRSTSGYTYYIEYDNGWHLRTYADGYYITDGTNYMVVSNTSINNTTNKFNASVFSFSNAGTNPSGNITILGTTNGLRDNNGMLQVSTTVTSFSNNGNNIYNGNNYLACYGNLWGLINGTTISGYTFSRDGYYLSVDSLGNLITSTTQKTVWSATSGNIQDRMTKRYLNLNQNINTSTSGVTINNSSSTLYYKRSVLFFSYYYYIYLNDNVFSLGQTTSTSFPNTSKLTFTQVSQSIVGTSKVVKTENNIIKTITEKVTDPIPEIICNEFHNNLNSQLSQTDSEDYRNNIFNTSLQNCEKEIERNVRSGNPCYFPLRVDKDENGNYPNGFAASPRNTGYLVSGAYLEETAGTGTNPQGCVGDIRVAGWPLEKISSSYNSQNRSFSTIYTVDGDNSIRSLTSAEKQDPTYTSALEQFGTTLASSTKVYGVHFMDSSISTEHTIRANKAIILGQTYYNYELPQDSIDFNVYQKGRISFFAGEYFTNNNTFFSLHRIFRDSNNDITEIKEISEVYDHAQKHDKANYIYKFSDGTYTNANGSYTGTTVKDPMYSTNPVFKTSWITNPQGLSDSGNRLFYFSIPCNAGEYALGSVSGRNGAYLCYLDIATNGGDTMLDYIKTKETVTTFNVDYRSANEITPHSILQLGGNIPLTMNPENFSITVNFDNTSETCEGTPYSGGIYTIYVVNKTDQMFELSVLLIDDDDDLYNEFNYAYRIVYTNADNTEEVIICTPLNDSGGPETDYWQRLAIFEIPPDGEAKESDYSN